MADVTLHSLLTAGATELGIELSPAQTGRLLTLADELLEWNARFNLTAIRDPREVISRHLLDSLSVHRYLEGERCADVGTGAGFPGLPLAIVDARRHFTLVEATGKKARFVEHAAARLGCVNVVTVNSRVEQWKPDRPFDDVISRALGSLRDFIRFAGHLPAPKGRLLAMKGRYPEEEIAAIPPSWRVVATPRLRVPGLDAERHLVILARAAGPNRKRAADAAAGSR